MRYCKWIRFCEILTSIYTVVVRICTYISINIQYVSMVSNRFSTNTIIFWPVFFFFWRGRFIIHFIFFSFSVHGYVSGSGKMTGVDLNIILNTFFIFITITRTIITYCIRCVYLQMHAGTVRIQLFANIIYSLYIMDRNNNVTRLQKRIII